MDKKIIFLDIDGTLVAELGKPTPKVKEAISRVRENGHKVFLCTGRNMPIIDHELLELGLDGVVASAGSHIEVDGEVLLDQLMPEAEVQKCLSVFHKNHLFARIESADGIYLDKEMGDLLRNAVADAANSELIRMQKEMQSSINLQEYEEYPRNGAYKLCFTCTDEDDLKHMEQELGTAYHYVIHPHQPGASCFNGEIIRDGLDKGEAMELVCKHYGKTLKDTIAFGDSMNDFQMIQTADLGIAMGNACQELKNAADMVCGSVEEDGIYSALKNLQLF